MLGNFMADSIKGKRYLDYPKEISNGIVLHRFIDDFTDHHHQVTVTKNRLREVFGRYASPVSDIIYDHFLAVNFTELTGLDLHIFVQSVYRYMDANKSSMTPVIQDILPYMIEHNWLENYQDREGLNKIFRQFGRRIGVDDLLDTATDIVWAGYADFENDFRLFFPELEKAVDDKRLQLSSH